MSEETASVAQEGAPSAGKGPGRKGGKGSKKGKKGKKKN